jgi:hypothetical protein
VIANSPMCSPKTRPVAKSDSDATVRIGPQFFAVSIPAAGCTQSPYLRAAAVGAIACRPCICRRPACTAEGLPALQTMAKHGKLSTPPPPGAGTLPGPHSGLHARVVSPTTSPRAKRYCVTFSCRDGSSRVWAVAKASNSNRFCLAAVRTPCLGRRRMVGSDPGLWFPHTTCKPLADAEPVELARHFFHVSLAACQNTALDQPLRP